VHDNTIEVNEHLCATPTCFSKAMKDGIRQGAASAMAVVHFHFSDLVDVGELVEGLPEGTRDSNMVLLMPCLEEAADAILVIASLDEVLHSPSSDHEG
jgi:hypothetical protein